MNRDTEPNLSQIIAGLEWYAKVCKVLGHCTVDKREITAYLKTIKELTEENERLSDERNRYKRYYFNHCFDELRANVEADVRADTVKKMQTEIEARCIKGGIYPAFIKSTIAKIAEEIIEGETK